MLRPDTIDRLRLSNEKSSNDATNGRNDLEANSTSNEERPEKSPLLTFG
jgi:hypothetical protein